MTSLKSSVIRLLVCLNVMTGAGAAFADDGGSSLVIAGGGLKSATADVWQAFLHMAKGDGPIVIIPAASGSPAASAQSVQQTLTAYGMPPENIRIAKLAVRDDSSTKDVNEAAWAGNAQSAASVALIDSASAIWFTGGDQARITRILTTETGQDTPALRALKNAAARQIPIGGTSAGAAMMSRSMILQGDSLVALTGSREGEALKTGPGLGFFRGGLVDQHFGERARLGRLAKALTLQTDAQLRLGFGVDENTALVVFSDNTARVAGTGYVTMIDARDAQFKSLSSGHTAISNMTLHMVSAGDRIDLKSLRITPADWKKSTVGNEYLTRALPGGGGMALSGQTLQAVIGEGLIDNQDSQLTERISFDAGGRGLRYVFKQSDISAGFWGRDAAGAGQYAISHVGFDIVPVKLSVETLK